MNPGASALICPRCGELIPYRSPDGPTASQEKVPDKPAPHIAESPIPNGPSPVSAQPTNRAVAIAVLAVMGGMAVAALVLALMTQKTRRARDKAEAPTQPQAVSILVLSPAKLPGLAYLPQDADVVAGVHVTEALETPAGRELLTRSSLASEANGVGQLEKWTGLKLEEFHYFVIGLTITEPALKITVVAETIRPFDEAKLRKTLQASSLPDLGLRCPNDRTLIVTWSPKEKELPEKPNPATGLPAPLQTLLKERVGKGSQIWAVGHVEDWDKPLARLLLATLPQEAQAVVAVKTFALCLQFDQEATLNGAFECADEAAAKKFGESLASHVKDEVKLAKVQQGPWLTIQARGSVESISKAFRQVEEGPAKEGP